MVDRCRQLSLNKRTTLGTASASIYVWCEVSACAQLTFIAEALSCGVVALSSPCIGRFSWQRSVAKATDSMPQQSSVMVSRYYFCLQLSIQILLLVGPPFAWIPYTVEYMLIWACLCSKDSRVLSLCRSILSFPWRMLGNWVTSQYHSCGTCQSSIVSSCWSLVSERQWLLFWVSVLHEKVGDCRVGLGCCLDDPAFPLWHVWKCFSDAQTHKPFVWMCAWTLCTDCQEKGGISMDMHVGQTCYE